MSITTQEIPWHDGENEMHRLLKVPSFDNPNASFLTPQQANMLQTSPLLALGTLDKEGRPWVTIWGGEAGFARQIAPSIIGTRTMVESRYDPVAKILFPGGDDGEVVKEEGAGRMISGLGIDLETRRRVKLFGRMVAGSLGGQEEKEGTSAAEVQLVVKIEQSLGNCPKYLNCKHIYPALPEPELVSRSRQLPPEALSLIAKADSLFIASTNRDVDMDCNLRGGPSGFVRIVSNESDSAVLVWPEYSGNRLYQTLGNLRVSPKAGVVIPDFETGDVLYLTGETRVLIAQDAASILPRSTVAIRFEITSALFVKRGLPFRGTPLEPSPYNPAVRYLPSEHLDPTIATTSPSSSSLTAKLISKQKLTPTITRYRFSLSTPPTKPWYPGQYVALSFREELDMGYSHMRDDDPRSINDDFVRTFTISSPPGQGLHAEEFEITARNVGSVTNWMAMTNPRAGVEIPVVGIGGEFKVGMDDDEKGEGVVVPFVAGGIGITPLLPSLDALDLKRLRLLWAVNVRDLGLVRDTFERYPGLAGATKLFVGGTNASAAGDDGALLSGLEGATVEQRRLTRQDLEGLQREVKEWYLCSGPKMRKDVLQWLGGQTVHWEDFDY